MKDDAKPKIAFLEHASKIGGGQDVLFRFLDEAEHDFEVSVVTGGEGPFTERLKSSGFKCHILPARLEYGVTSDPVKLAGFVFQSVSLGLRLARLVRRERIALLVANHTYAIPHGVIASMLTKVPLVAIVHSVLDEKVMGLSEARFVSMLLKRSDAKAICISRAVAAPLLRGGLDENRIRYVHSWIAVPPEATLRQRRESPMTFGVFGRLIPEKGHELFLRAGAMLLKSAPDTRFLIAGDPIFAKGDAGDYPGELKTLASALGIAGKVTFLPHQESLDELYRSVDAVVVPSTVSEAFNLVILEAMARAIPVIASNKGGNPEQVTDGITGFLFRSGDFQDLASKMSLLSSNRDGAAALGLAGRKRVEENFTREKNAPLFISVLKEAVLAGGRFPRLHGAGSPDPGAP
ncbi:MAG: glycosyltransferase [Candidatus Eisenbacteria bacterium]|nr:glycosyltransferase [Candidatus Eisenbacteria bacterium]